MITYEARQDNVGALVPAKAVRRCLVLKYRNGQFAYVCGAFTTMKGAEKRAAELNKSEGGMITANDIRAELELACREAGGQRAFARQINMSPAYVNAVLTGRVPPGPGVLEPLGLKAVIYYVPLTEEELAELREAHAARVAEEANGT